MTVSKEELLFSEKYDDVFADMVLPGAMKIGHEEFFRLTFVKHKLTALKIPGEQGVELPVELTKEAQFSVSIPMSVAEELAKAIDSIRNTPQRPA